MNVYIPLALYILLVSIFFQKSNKKSLLYFLTFVPLLLFFGTRVDMGVDYQGYLNGYELQRDWTFNQYNYSAAGGKFEPGFFMLMKIFPTFDSLIFGCTVCLLVPVAIFFYYFIPKGYYPLAFILYLFNPRIFESVIAMRSGVVIGLFLLAVVLKYRGYLKIAIAIVVISGTFHMSGYLLAPLLLISNKYLKSHYQLVSGVVVVLMAFALLSSAIFGSLVVRLSQSIEVLSDYRAYVSDASFGFGFLLFSIVRVLFVVYVFSLLKRGKIADNYLWIAWMTIFCYFLHMVQGVEIMYRIVYYFYLITIPFKCYVWRVDKSLYSKLYVGVSIVFLIYETIEFAQLEQTQRVIWNYHSFIF